MLSCFSFAKEAMYRDLLDHEDLAAAHPAVGALAAGGRGEASAGFFFDEIPEHEIDSRAAPESHPGDPGRRRLAAGRHRGRARRPVVRDGRPSRHGQEPDDREHDRCVLHAGKTVLFVSEKAAALDVVRDRLAERRPGRLPA